jgi:hypothetical protein
MHIYVFCLDEESYQQVRKLRLPDVTVVALAELEEADRELLSVKKDRTVVEYYFTCTSCAGWYLMQTRPEIQILTYLDSDLFFYSSVEPLFREFEGHSIAVTHQRFPGHGLHSTGRFNVGWVSWRRDSNGIACLKEYRRQCLEWCFMREEAGKFADQAYLDAWDSLPGFHVFPQRGANVAPWNLAFYKLTYDRDAILVDGYPLIFFHFHKFACFREHWFDSNLWRACRVTTALRKRLIRPYIDELRKSGLSLPLACCPLRHFPYRHGLGLLARNVVRFALILARQSYVYYPRVKPTSQDSARAN